MNDSKTLIRSSLISLIIVIFGLFMLCMSRGAKVNVDEQFIEGGGVEAESEEMSDDDFLSLLESSDNEVYDDEDDESVSEAFELDDTSGDSESEDADLAEILQLLNLDDGETSRSGSDDEDTDELDMLLAEAETGGASEKVDAVAYQNMESEIETLEKVLDEKNTKVDSIQRTIQEYDDQIAQLEGGSGNYPGGATGNSTEFDSYTPGEQGASDLNDSKFSAASSYNEQYNIALSYFSNVQYQLAALAFQKLLHENQDHELADNCQYWIGECQFARGNYLQAIVEFEKVFSFDSPDKKDDAQLMVGLASMKAGKTQNAKTELTWFLACYETSEYFKRAQQYLSELL